ncbi:MAG: phospholipase D family protein [Desulfuromonadaceae bacterium]|nr:phospholipase D family protein [Desulfuromonadaceae bacterium]
MALSPTEAKNTRLGQALSPLLKINPGRTGVFPLADAHDAFAARMILAQVAERTLDIQYYIWRGDMTGTLLFEALHAAADRGVRVRLLLDDNNTSRIDATLAALTTHPNIEVRLFNPFRYRALRFFDFMTDFARVNRRMHNKSFTADNQVTIVGGRNIGDEYFGAMDSLVFADLDVIAMGPVVRELSHEFDRYWSSASSWPADRILPPADPARIEELAAAATRTERNPAAAAYMEALRRAPIIRQMLEGKLNPEWAITRMVSDDPAKVLGKAKPERMIIPQLREAIGEPTAEVELVSPYFVPTKAGVKALSAFSHKGVRIQVLTNSLNATDVAAVHAGYAKRRKALLKAGVKLFELRRKSSKSKGDKRVGPFGSSGSSLHAKTFSVDRSRIFIGSFNFDPRSAQLNTELGFVIESSTLAREIETAFNEFIPQNAYEVKLSRKGRLYWLERRGKKVIRHDKEPGATFWKRTGITILSWLPIEWLL